VLLWHVQHSKQGSSCKDLALQLNTHNSRNPVAASHTSGADKQCSRHAHAMQAERLDAENEPALQGLQCKQITSHAHGDSVWFHAVSSHQELSRAFKSMPPASFTCLQLLGGSCTRTLWMSLHTP
jgi:hypothetical protein